MADTYGCIVIGAGQGGTPLAVAMANAGRRVAVVEREEVGGTCINTGCTPSKTMLASAYVAHLARRASEYGVEVGGTVRVDLGEVLQRREDIVQRFRAGVQRRLDAAPGLDLLRGEARFLDRRTLEVTLRAGGARQIQSDLIVIDTGSRATLPPVAGLDGVVVYDEDRIPGLDRLPEHLLILGGGYVGVEFGQMFRRFGSDVTIIERGPQLLANEDPDIAAELTAVLTDEGVQVLLDREGLRAEQEAGGAVRLLLQGPDGELAVRGSHLLVAAGRAPNTEALNLPAAGVATDARGHVRVNARLETNVPGIYAIGDVTGGPAFTHISYDDYRILCANLLEGGSASTEGRLVPYTVFTDPQLGRVGLSERQAREQRRNIRVAKLPMSAVARAIEIGQARGLMKAVVDADTDQILGCAILGVEGGELMALIEVAMLGGLPYPALRDAVLAHPTLAESVNNLFSSFEG